MTRRIRTRRGICTAGAALLGIVALAMPTAVSGGPAVAETTTATHAGTSSTAPAGVGIPQTIAPGPQERAAELVADMTTREQAASVVMGHISTTDPDALRAYMAQGWGGFILMGGNIPASDDELRAITAALGADSELPPLIAIDQEGGIVSRLSDDDYPASRTLKSEPVDRTAAAFAARASLVAQHDITVNFGTVADVTADPSSFIYGRALGTDQTSAAERVAAATVAQERFLASTLKHFPGHGAAPGDSHHAIPSTDETWEQWRASDAVPFIAGIDAGASLLMFGHLAYTSVDAAPASLSARWHEIARDELGFEGVIVSDDLGMLQSSGVPAYADPVANAVAALTAGTDLVLMIAGSTDQTAGQIADGVTAAVESGALSADRLADAATRVMALRLQSSAAGADWGLCEDCEPVG
ncbi:glycoside hydrolase family 3 N-terminal domain-containing protein [uncultured Microbacterium sp.]|uniref:glycoside hydrolase family 3 N-terminal domain-containing protein n=1 Tax=uncultured Microbacterium sp. TaxID=191216 RepID=UPI0028D0C481|nr:glycoside hydrolase family 3 N-terminal domain-containing protein [uncultured Microbacterium sp.]